MTDVKNSQLNLKTKRP